MAHLHEKKAPHSALSLCKAHKGNLTFKGFVLCGKRGGKHAQHDEDAQAKDFPTFPLFATLTKL